MTDGLAVLPFKATIAGTCSRCGGAIKPGQTVEIPWDAPPRHTTCSRGEPGQ